MGEQTGLFPTPDGLSRGQAERLARLADVETASVADLLDQVETHADDARRAHAGSRLVNVRFAEAIRDAFRCVAGDWDRIPVQGRYWLLGAMRYFVSCDDDEPDFQSAIGFEDDAEVLNACLRMSGRPDLCLTAEDYDDA